MTFDQLFVSKKIEQIRNYIKEVEDFLNFSDRDILTDSLKMHVAERLVQLIVDTMLDINQHFIRELNLKTGDDFQGTFYILASAKILPDDFAKKIAPIVAVRNRIVHGYESLDKEMFLKNLRKHYSDFADYADIIKKYLVNI